MDSITIKEARWLARTLAELIDGVVRCDFRGEAGMSLTATELKSYIDRWDSNENRHYVYKQTRSRDELPCEPIRWRAKPRGASSDEWQTLPESYVLETYNKYR